MADFSSPWGLFRRFFGSGPWVVGPVSWILVLVATALSYPNWPGPYGELQGEMSRMERGMHYLIIEEALNDLGEHEAPDREFEAVSYLIEFTLDYGAYREFKRHRMQTVMTQQPSPALGYTVPPLIQDAGLEEEFRNTMTMAEETHSLIDAKFPQAAPYVLTHAHHRRMITRVNLRECYHMLKLRTPPQAHAAIGGPLNDALSDLMTLGNHLVTAFSAVAAGWQTSGILCR